VKLHDKQFYKENYDNFSYQKAQIERHKAKYMKERGYDHYAKCSEHIIDLIHNDSYMVCMGTRNNHERNVFGKLLSPKNVKVYSLDISELSKADYIMDFNHMPKEWDNKWDILFSNSLDHAADSTSVFYKWLGIVKKGGIMVLGFDIKTPEAIEVVGSADCCSFDAEMADAFMKSRNEKFEFINCFENSYIYYVLIKK